MKSSASQLAILTNTPLSISQDRKESERFYTGLFNSVVGSFPLAGEPVFIKKLDELGPAIKVYEDRFRQALERGDATPEEIFSCRQCSSLLKKLELPVFEKKAKEAALGKWLDSEAACKETNRELSGFLTGQPVQADLEALIKGIRGEILTLLGEDPPDLPDVIGNSRFGPGASSSVKREFRHPLYQMNSLSAFRGMELEVQWVLRNTMMTEANAVGYYGCSVPKYVSNDWREVYKRVEFLDYERYEDVPKSIDSSRTIGVGPNLATFVSQAYDHNLRERLRNWGLDLRDQRPNQHLAYMGSLNGVDCTLDLSEASNRVSLGLVFSTFPSAWFRVLYPLRAAFCKLPDGRLVRQEKFASMGNSLTFSVMTLILGALIRYTLKERNIKGARWRVYGDDVIVPFDIYNTVVSRLSKIGLLVNPSKSYSQFSFRESCGRDYFAGVNVRPLYIKKPIVFVTDLYKYLNLVRVVEERCPIKFTVFGALREFLIRWIPSNLRVWGEPSRYLDRYIWGPVGMGRPRFLVVTDTTFEPPADLQAYLMRLYSGGKVESFVRLDGNERAGYKTGLYPDARVLVNKGDAVFRSLRRKPGREAWEMLRITSIAAWNEDT